MIYITPYGDAHTDLRAVCIKGMFRAARVSLSAPIPAKYLRDWSDDDGFPPPAPAAPAPHPYA